MRTLLHIDASPRLAESVSRALSGVFVEGWRHKNPEGRVVRRDLAKTVLPFVTSSWIRGAYSPEEQHTPDLKAAITQSNELTNELLEADEIVLGTPMYNFNVPANLKAWIDQVVRVGKTFQITGDGVHGLIPGGRKATFIIASGSDFGRGKPMEKWDYESSYLRAIFGFIGIADTKVVKAGGVVEVARGRMSLDDYLALLTPEVLSAIE